MSETFLGRQPVVRRSGDVIGYELFFRAGEGASAAMANRDLEASASVLASLLCNYGNYGLSAEHLLFINVDLATVADRDFISLLPKGNIVLDLHGKAKDAGILVGQMDYLRRQGVRISLDEEELFADLDSPLVADADFIKVDVQKADTLSLYRLALALEGRKKTIIAKRVESTEDVSLCDEVGIGYFQGYRFGMPVVIRERTLSPSFSVLADALGLLGQEASAEDVEDVLKRDPALMVRLLVYANSPAVGAAKKINNLDEIILLLGYQQLHRWVALLLYTSQGEGLPAAMVESMLARARCMELCGATRGLSKRDQDNLFVVGVLSMAETALGMPPDKLLQRIMVPDEVAGALLRAAVPYGPFLLLAQAFERSDFETVAKAARYFRLPAERLNEIQMAAMAWAGDMARGVAAA